MMNFRVLLNLVNMICLELEDVICIICIEIVFY